jgi:D-Tyr-tRNAtyr deacylase
LFKEGLMVCGKRLRGGVTKESENRQGESVYQDPIEEMDENVDQVIARYLISSKVIIDGKTEIGYRPSFKQTLQAVSG